MEVSPSQAQDRGLTSWISEGARSIGSRIWSAVSGMIWTPPIQKEIPSEIFVLVGDEGMSSSVCLAPPPPKELHDENGLVFRLAPPAIRSGTYAEEDYKGPEVNKQFVKDVQRAIDNRLVYINRKPCAVKSGDDLTEITKKIFRACNEDRKLFNNVTEILNQRVLLDLKHQIQEQAKKHLEMEAGWNPLLMERDIESLETYYDTEKPTDVVVKSRGAIRYIMKDLEIEKITPITFTAEAIHDLEHAATTYTIVICQESSPDEAKT